MLDKRSWGRGSSTAGQPWASCSLHPGPGLTQPSILSWSVNEYQLGRFKTGMCDAAWCTPCTWAPLRWLCLLRGAITNVWPLPLPYPIGHVTSLPKCRLDHLVAWFQPGGPLSWTWQWADLTKFCALIGYNQNYHNSFHCIKGNWSLLYCLLCSVVKSFVHIFSSLQSSAQFRFHFRFR